MANLKLMELSAMIIKIVLFSLFLFSACGKNVTISTKELRSNSSLSDGKALATNKEGILKRNTTDTITYNGTSKKVSIYSSYQALEFIAIRPLKSETQVKYREGKNNNNEMVLEFIEAK